MEDRGMVGKLSLIVTTVRFLESGCECCNKMVLIYMKPLVL